MKEFVELTETLASLISSMENYRKKLGEVIKEFNSSNKLQLDKEIFEEKIILPAEKMQLDNIRIAGVDGGLVKKTFHGIDLMLLRAVGVIFAYDNNKLSKVDYYPNSIPTPEPKTIIDPFSDLEFEINSSIERQITEITVARETIEKFEPDILFLHGSVIPHYTFVPDKGSLLYVNYKRMIEAYTKLFETVKQKKTILAGAIEDSRGTRFCEIINTKVISQIKTELPAELKLMLNRTKDSNLLTYALKYAERTFVFPYSFAVEQHSILKEFPSFSNQIFTFYVKTAEFDRPIRVDFLADKGTVDTANKLSSALLSLSGHSSYGIPSVLIEADQRAKLSEEDLEMFYWDIINKAGNLPGLFEQRRNQRPF
jgi:hypothetical protein